MKVSRKYKTVFEGGEDENLIIQYGNRGEPFREGLSFNFKDLDDNIIVFLNTSELRELRDLLNQLLPPDKSQ